MAKVIAGYGIKVMTDTGSYVWLTEEGTHRQNTKAMRFDSEDGAEMYRNMLTRKNPGAVLITKKLSS